MPKYRDKLRLRCFRLKHGATVDYFTEYLILKGCSDDVARQGLRFFAEDWKRTIEYYIQGLKSDPPGFGLCAEEFEYDVWKRAELYYLWQLAPEKMRSEVRKMIETADLIFRRATVKSHHPYDVIKDPDPEEHWWLYRIPLDGLH